MKAVVWTKYGSPDVLQTREVKKPAPQDHEVLIRIHASSAAAGDCEIRNLKIPILFRMPMRFYVGLIKPERITILGQEFAGEIEAAGKLVTIFKEGDQIFGATGFRFGAYAEYMCLPEKPGVMEGLLAIKPANLTYTEAAAVPVGGLEAVRFLRAGNIHSGQKVLIIGAGGSIGTIAVQLARYYGAEVTGVDSPGKLDMLRSIGAQHVIDYTAEDFKRSGQTYDVVFDVVGKTPFSQLIRLLKPGGRLLLANPGLSHTAAGLRASLAGGKKVIHGAVSRKTEDLIFLRDLIEAGKIHPVIDRCYPLDQAAEAHRYVETGQKKGNVVLSLEPGQPGQPGQPGYKP